MLLFRSARADERVLLRSARADERVLLRSARAFLKGAPPPCLPPISSPPLAKRGASRPFLTSKKWSSDPGRCGIALLLLPRKSRDSAPARIFFAPPIKKGCSKEGKIFCPSLLCYNNTMAKTSYIYILPELEESYWKNLQPGDRFSIPRIRRKIPLLSVQRKKGLTQRSLLPQVAAIWNAFSDEQKAAWVSAAEVWGRKGYNLFVQDQCLRIKNEWVGVATPSLFHQSYVGILQIDEPADELKIIQIHPHFYWISKKVKGTKSQYSPVLVTEDFALPLTISLSYRAEMEAVSEEHFAKFYARVWHSYQGRDIYTELEIPLDYIDDWKTVSNTLTNVLGYVVRYDLYFHLKGVRGTLYIDNVKAEHSTQNWCRDSACRDINQGFTKAYYQIPKHWSGLVVPNGSWFESFYIDW